MMDGWWRVGVVERWGDGGVRQWRGEVVGE